jgi:hypothetical protein
MSNRVLECLIRVASRRTVLKTMARGAGAIGLALMGIREAGATIAYLCCNLCVDPSSCTYGGCTCEWCWSCCTSDGCVYACDECYSASGSWCGNRTQPGGCPCNSLTTCTQNCLSTGTPVCNNIICSRARQLSCPPAPCPPVGNPPYGGEGVCWSWSTTSCSWVQVTCNSSPILIDVSANGFELTSLADGVTFDMSGNGHPVQLSWTAKDAGVAFLALPGPDGLVHNGKQLFGNWTDQPVSANPNGFAALAVWDDPKNGGNGDGIIDSRDAIFASLRLWIDADHDGICQPEELHTLPSLGINSISLKYNDDERRDQYGNLFHYRSRVNPDDPSAERVGRSAYDVFFVTLNQVP